jgi:aldehyde dehydrogenase (NAD+)
MPSIFTYEFDTPTYKGRTKINTGLFIDGKWVDGSNNTTIEYAI